MNWYMAKIVYRIVCGEGTHKPQFDEQLRLIGAPDPDTAFEKATELGKLEGGPFFDQKEKLVQWQFINVAGLYRIDNLMDGAELYSQVSEAEDPEHYMQLVHKRAEHIRENIRHNLLTAY
jgi:hypothetical protein